MVLSRYEVHSLQQDLCMSCDGTLQAGLGTRYQYDREHRDKGKDVSHGRSSDVVVVARRNPT